MKQSICMALIAGCCFANVGRAQQPEYVLQELPLLLDTPTQQEYMRAWYDGEVFYFDVAALFSALGFMIADHGETIDALDINRRFTLSATGDSAYALVPGAEEAVSMSGLLWRTVEGRVLIAAEGLEILFGADITFEEERLALRLSTRAERFTLDRPIPALPFASAPGPMRFPRPRSILGGMTADYTASWSYRRGRPNYAVHTLGHALWGSVDATVVDGNRSTASYMIDRPESHTLTRVQVGWMHSGYSEYRSSDWALRTSNKPLASQALQRYTSIRGTASPHALVEVEVGGTTADRVEADADGRYELQIPVWYGTTQAIIKITPLGGGTVQTERRLFNVGRELIQPRRFFYDAFVGPWTFAQAEYGLHNRITLRANGGRQWEPSSEPDRLSVGVSTAPLPRLMISLEGDLINSDSEIRVGGWLGRGSVDISAGSLRGRRYVRGSGAAAVRRLSTYLFFQSEQNAAFSFTRGSGRLRYDGKSGLTVTGQVSAYRSRFATRVSNTALSWLAGTGWRKHASGHTLFFRLESSGWGGAWQTAGVSVHWASRRMSLGGSAYWDSSTDGIAGSLTLQWRAPFVTLASQGRRYGTGAYFQRHTVTGGLNVGPGIRMYPYGGRQSSARVRLFEDLNGDGVFSSGEHVLSGASAQVWQGGMHQSTAKGIIVQSLEPYKAYQTTIDPASIPDPGLHPAPGYSFSFMAVPGGMARIDVPLVRPVLVSGRVTGGAGGVWRIDVVQGGTVLERLNVYRDGAFTLLSPGTSYSLRLINLITGGAVAEQEVAADQSTVHFIVEQLNTQ